MPEPLFDGPAAFLGGCTEECGVPRYGSLGLGCDPGVDQAQEAQVVAARRRLVGQLEVVSLLEGERGTGPAPKTLLRGQEGRRSSAQAQPDRAEEGAPVNGHPCLPSCPAG